MKKTIIREEAVRGHLIELRRILTAIADEYGGKTSFIVALDVEDNYTTFYYTGHGQDLDLARKVVDRLELGKRIQKRHEEGKIPLGSRTWAFRFRFASEYRDDFQSGEFASAPSAQRQSNGKR